MDSDVVKADVHLDKITDADDWTEVLKATPLPATLGEKDPKARAIKPGDFVDLRSIKELDQSGFIDALCAR
jgi:hypothetical protein